MQQAALFRRERQLGVVIVVLWLFEVCCFVLVCVNQRYLRETLGFLLCGLIEYSYVNILPQITQMHEECS